MATDTDTQKISILGKESIHCGFHLIPYIVHTLLTSLPTSTFALITDWNIAHLHLKAFEDEFTAQLEKKGLSSRFVRLAIPPGEASKSREGKAQVEDWLLSNKCTRDTVVLALGGGVIGDLVGFVAATFMRGLRFVQIPTTLLAMVDSSVGGKTAIDTLHGKNLIGAFWQPEFIFIDAAFLETLPTREFSNGMAEVVKTAAVWDESKFTDLESRSSEIFAAIQTSSTNHAGRSKATRSAAQEILLDVIVGSISVKSYIVTKDERETGLRGLVNFGHTIGHAIEAVLSPTILHGECVSVGMILEAEVSRQLGILSQVGVGRLSRCLQAYKLPISLFDPRIATLPAAKLISVDRLMDIMGVDKKNSGTNKRIVLLKRIGETFEEKATVVKDVVISQTLADAITIIPGLPTKNPVKMSTPGSKSLSNRALVLAALGKGTCRLKNLLHSDDTQVMMAALNELKGAKFTWEDGGETLVVEGGLGSLSVPPEGKELYLGNAGTAARILTTLCTLVSATPGVEGHEQTIITGNPRMKQRPIGPLVTALRANGSKIDYLETTNCLPLAIAPQGLKGGLIQLAANVSSQYVSSILICAPYAKEPVTLELSGSEVVSQQFIDLTIAIMKTFGVEVSRRVDPDSSKHLDVYDIPIGIYVNPAEYKIESDASSATYPLAIAAITGTSCTIENIGSTSLQGDAKFAKEVLERMGCEVVQTPTETTVRGCPKGSLKAIEEIDMEEMTDAFLTATALAAVASGKTRIRGIANQRVKECNRIRAMIDQLAKFGVETVELPDGLEIIGKPIENLNTGVSVRCYDDHRVAMAFSVLATVVEGTILEEKRCVQKTWPNWWDDLQNKIGINIKGVELNEITSDTSIGAHTHEAGASILLIGMRGAGKTFIGNMAAAALSWTCLDADLYFEEKHKICVRDFVHQRGWSAFREAEIVVAKEMIEAKPQGHIISLGGGIVETPVAREFLKHYASRKGPVVRIVRPLSDVIAYLDTEGSRPAYGEPVPDVFRRRNPWFAECSNYLFDNQFGADSDTKTTFKEVVRFFGHISGQYSNISENIKEGGRTYFLSLTYPDVTRAADQIEELTEGVDALELRVDLLKSAKDYESFQYTIPSLSFVQEQMTKLRRLTSLPVVFTVRSKSQGGAFPDTARAETLELLKLALQLGVEYIDVELTLPEKDIELLTKRKGYSKIIASWHEWTGRMKWVGVEVKEKFDLARKLGDIVKIVGKAESLNDNFALYSFVQAATHTLDAKPLIAINTGIDGQMSRVLNPTFSPVSHPLLPNKAAPGQLSFREIQQSLHLLGLLPSQRFYLFGTPISQSLSPILHNTAFNTLCLPHKYELLETQTVGEEIKIAITSPDFGGASVTIPFKIDIIPLLDKLTPAAEAIGAINTIIPKSIGSGRTLVGDNTDWIGIRTCIALKLGERPLGAALVIGAGGTARAAIYALQSLHVEAIYLYNRTLSKAKNLAHAFPEARVRLVSRLGSWPGAKPRIIVSTVPTSATAVFDDVEDPSAGISLPNTLFDYRGGPAVVLDMAYRQAETPLLGLAKMVAGENWLTVTGIEVLLEQGYEQFRIWTGRRCPKHRVAERVLKNVQY